MGPVNRASNVIPFQEKSVPSYKLIPSTIADRPIYTSWSTDVAVQFGYKAATWVYACITKRMKAAASVPLKTQVQVDGVWVDRYVPGLSDLITRPNNKYSFQDLTETVVSHLDLGGNALLSKVRVRGKPAELWVLRPDKIRPVPSTKDYIGYYEYTVDGKKIKLDPRDIIHFRFIDPANEYWGISPLMAAGKTVDMEVAAVNWNYSSMNNRAVPDGMVTLKKELSPKQFAEANAMLENQLMGPANVHRPFVMGYDADYRRFALTPAEMDFVKSRVLTREEICAAFAVPPPLVGIYDKATLTNIETARVIFWADTMVPLLDDILDVYNFCLSPEFGANVRIVYDTSGVQALQVLFQRKVETGTKLFGMGVPFNTINKRLGLGFDDIPGGDVGYIPSSMEPSTGGGDLGDIPGGSPPGMDDEPEPDEIDEPDPDDLDTEE
jgi:HK97 family phage portal protein